MGLNSFYLIWSMSDQDSIAVKEMEVFEFINLINSFIADIDMRITGLKTPIESYSLNNLIVNNPSIDKCTLVGDSACTVHPLAGQGLNIHISSISYILGILTDLIYCGYNYNDLFYHFELKYNSFFNLHVKPLFLLIDSINTLCTKDSFLVNQFRLQIQNIFHLKVMTKLAQSLVF